MNLLFENDAKGCFEITFLSLSIIKDILNSKDAFKLFQSQELDKKYSKDDFEFKVSFKYLDSIRKHISDYKHEAVKDNNNVSTTCF